MMKHIRLKSFIVVFSFSIAGLALAYSGSMNVNNSQDVTIVTEYQCKILDTDCVVDKVKYVQSGAVYYDAECNADRMSKTEFENDAINDVKGAYFSYCYKTARTLKGAS